MKYTWVTLLCACKLIICTTCIKYESWYMMTASFDPLESSLIKIKHCLACAICTWCFSVSAIQKIKYDAFSQDMQCRGGTTHIKCYWAMDPLYTINRVIFLYCRHSGKSLPFTLYGILFITWWWLQLSCYINAKRMGLRGVHYTIK